jgi:hypothetical protein
MKKRVSMLLFAVTAMALTVGPAFADDDKLPTLNDRSKEIGTVLYEETYPQHIEAGSAPGGVRTEPARKADAGRQKIWDEMFNGPGNDDSVIK